MKEIIISDDQEKNEGNEQKIVESNKEEEKAEEQKIGEKEPKKELQYPNFSRTKQVSKTTSETVETPEATRINGAPNVTEEPRTNGATNAPRTPRASKAQEEKKDISHEGFIKKGIKIFEPKKICVDILICIVILLAGGVICNIKVIIDFYSNISIANIITIAIAIVFIASRISYRIGRQKSKKR